jgi:hypothetical protein
MKKILFTIIVLATACGGEDDPKPTVAPEFLYTRHVANFYSEATKRGKNLTQITPKVYFVDNLDVQCDAKNFTYSNSYPSNGDYVIELNSRIYSDELNDGGLETVIFREMAHLLLGKPYGDVEYKSEGGAAFVNIMYKCTDLSYEWNQQQVRALDYLFN